VRTAGPARIANPSDDLTPFDFLPFRHVIYLIVGVDGDELLIVLYDDDIAEPLYLLTTVKDFTKVGSSYRSSHRGGDVDSSVFYHAPYAEFLGDFAPNGPDELPFCRSDLLQVLRASPFSSDIIDIDIDLQHPFCIGDKYLLPYPDPAGVSNVVYAGYLIDINPIGLTYSPQSLVSFHRMIDP